MIKQLSNRQPTSYLSTLSFYLPLTLLLQLYTSVYSLCNNPKDNQWVEYLRQLETNNPTILQRIFVRLRFCCVERIASYVTETTKPKTDKKTSKMVGLFVSSCLRTCSSSTAPLLFVLGRYSKPSFTSCKLRFLRSVLTQLTVACDDLEQVPAPIRL